MDRIGKIWFACAFTVFIIFIAVVVQTFRPVRNVQPDDVLEINGKVIAIQEGPGFDISITLENDDHYYYINRGLRYNLSLGKLRTEILNKNVTLYPVKRWTLFTRDGNMGHISKLLYDDRVIYNELNNDIHEQTTN